MNGLERRLRRIDGFQQRHTIPGLLFALTKKYGDDNAGALGVQLTYALFVTVFPLLLLLITVLGIVLADDPGDRHRVVTSAFGEFPIVGSALAHNIHALKRSSVFGLVVGLVGLLYGTTNLAQAGLYSMEQVWNIPGAARPNVVKRMARSLTFLAVLAVGLVLGTALAGFGTFGRHNAVLGLLGELLAALVNVALYLAAFRVLTPRQVSTRLLLPGVVLGGIGWTVLQAVGGYVVGHDLKGASAVYGLFGLVLGLIAWISLGVQLTLYAAELNTVLHHRLWPRSMIQPPLTRADQLSLALQATENQRRPEQRVSSRFTVAPMTQDEYRANDYRQRQDGEGLVHRAPDDSSRIGELDAAGPPRQGGPSDRSGPRPGGDRVGSD